MTTTADAIRSTLAAQMQTIVSRYEPDRAARFVFKDDLEVCGELRNFDIRFDIEREVPEGWYGGGIEVMAPVEIVVSYPVSEPRLRRLAGADWLDLACVLYRLHESVNGLIPFSMQVDENPEPVVSGDEGRYTVTWTVEFHWMASDEVTTQAVA